MHVEKRPPWNSDIRLSVAMTAAYVRVVIGLALILLEVGITILFQVGSPPELKKAFSIIHTTATYGYGVYLVLHYFTTRNLVRRLGKAIEESQGHEDDLTFSSDYLKFGKLKKFKMFGNLISFKGSIGIGVLNGMAIKDIDELLEKHHVPVNTAVALISLLASTVVLCFAEMFIDLYFAKFHILLLRWLPKSFYPTAIHSEHGDGSYVLFKK